MTSTNLAVKLVWDQKASEWSREDFNEVITNLLQQGPTNPTRTFAAIDTLYSKATHEFKEVWGFEFDEGVNYSVADYSGKQGSVTVAVGLAKRCRALFGAANEFWLSQALKQQK